jgi:hypothetical protein
MPSQPEEYTRDVVALTGRFQPALAQPRMKRKHPIVRGWAASALGRRVDLFASIFGARHRQSRRGALCRGQKSLRALH